jgi:predicted secreted protein
MAKISAFGTVLSMGDGDTPTEGFDDVANVVKIGGPGLSLDTEDVTTHDSTNAWEEHVPTILRSGEMTLDIIYDPNEGTHDATDGLISKADGKTLTNFIMTFPDATEWEFAAYVTGFEPDGSHDGALTASVSLKITGQPTLV